MKNFQVWLQNGKVIFLKGLNIEKALREAKIAFQDMMSWELCGKGNGDWSDVRDFR